MKPASMRAELWIARRLRRLDLFAGVTTAEQRRERVRAAILSRDLGDAIAGTVDDERLTWAQVFRRAYAQSLEPAGEAA